MTKRFSKKKIIILVLLTSTLTIASIITILFVRWNSYYNKIWAPLTTIAYNTECDPYPYSYCGMCRNNPDMPMIHKNRDHMDYYFDLPEKFKYKGTVSYSHNPPFDKSIKGVQYGVFVHAEIGKDLSNIRWVVSLHVEESLVYGYNVYDAVIDPDTLEVIEEIYRRDEDTDYMKDCEDMIRDGISNLRSVFSPYLG